MCMCTHISVRKIACKYTLPWRRVGMLSVWQTLQGIADSGHARPCRQTLSP